MANPFLTRLGYGSMLCAMAAWATVACQQAKSQDLSTTAGDSSLSVLMPDDNEFGGIAPSLVPDTLSITKGWDPVGEVCEADDGELPLHEAHPYDNVDRGQQKYELNGACHGLPDPPGMCQWFGKNAHACWTTRVDALLLWRNAPRSRPLYSDVFPDTDEIGPTALNANELNSDVLAAPRLSLFRTDLDGRTIEATYLYAGNFYADRSLPYVPDGYATSPPGIYGNEWGPPDTSLDSASAKLLGQLQSVEFNLRYPVWTDTCQFLIGSRWVQWNETLQMQDFFSYTDPDPVTGKDTYETRCFNNLWGGQIGLDALLLGSPGTTRIEGLVKAGAYYNGAGQASTFRYKQSDGFDYDNQARAGGPAACSFVGEIGLTAVIPISCCCDFRCGYYGLWLTNIAQPTRQLSDQTINQFESAGTLDTAGSLILQGLSLGLESRF